MKNTQSVKLIKEDIKVEKALPLFTISEEIKFDAVKTYLIEERQLPESLEPFKIFVLLCYLPKGFPIANMEY